jgi:MoaA/NifB/PqqE/SkfB family radical SAM enzyme
MSLPLAALRAPLFVSWQLTRDCDLCCLHCCTESAPGKRLKDELDADEAMRVAGDIVANEVPYVMLCGGEPLVVPHFMRVAEALGRAGVELKIETNGQKLDAAIVERLTRLPIRSIQISLDGDSEETYQRQRPGASLARAHAACRAVTAAGLPLEVTFAPTRHNIADAPRVLARAKALGAFRFNTGRLMRIGTAARLWNTLEPSPAQYETFRALLDEQARIEREIELCYIPFDVADGLRQTVADPPATLLVLPNGQVKVAAALAFVCADLRRHRLAEAWQLYREAWQRTEVMEEARRAIEDSTRFARANRWQLLPAA